MAIVLKHPATLTHPAEYENTDPVYCATCSAEYDATQEGEDWKYDDKGEAQCVELLGKPSCFRKSQLRDYRAAVTYDLLPKLVALEREAANLSDRYDEVDDGEPVYGIIDMAAHMVRRYTEGLETGHRDMGTTLSRDEHFQIDNLLHDYENTVRASFRVALTRLGERIPVFDKPLEDPFVNWMMSDLRRHLDAVYAAVKAREVLKGAHDRPFTPAKTEEN